MTPTTPDGQEANENAAPTAVAAGVSADTSSPPPSRSSEKADSASETSTIVHAEVSKVDALINKWEVHIPVDNHSKSNTSKNKDKNSKRERRNSRDSQASSASGASSSTGSNGKFAELTELALKQYTKDNENETIMVTPQKDAEIDDALQEADHQVSQAQRNLQEIEDAMAWWRERGLLLQQQQQGSDTDSNSSLFNFNNTTNVAAAASGDDLTAPFESLGDDDDLKLSWFQQMKEQEAKQLAALGLTPMTPEQWKQRQEAWQKQRNEREVQRKLFVEEQQQQQQQLATPSTVATTPDAKSTPPALVDNNDDDDVDEACLGVTGIVTLSSSPQSEPTRKKRGREGEKEDIPAAAVAAATTVLKNPTQHQTLVKDNINKRYRPDLGEQTTTTATEPLVVNSLVVHCAPPTPTFQLTNSSNSKVVNPATSSSTEEENDENEAEQVNARAATEMATDDATKESATTATTQSEEKKNLRPQEQDDNNDHDQKDDIVGQDDDDNDDEETFSSSSLSTAQQRQLLQHDASAIVFETEAPVMHVEDPSTAPSTSDDEQANSSDEIHQEQEDDEDDANDNNSERAPIEAISAEPSASSLETKGRNLIDKECLKLGEAENRNNTSVTAAIEESEEDRHDDGDDDDKAPAPTKAAAVAPVPSNPEREERNLIDIDEECLKLIEAENRNTTFITGSIEEGDEEEDKDEEEEKKVEIEDPPTMVTIASPPRRELSKADSQCTIIDLDEDCLRIIAEEEALTGSLGGSRPSSAVVSKPPPPLGIAVSSSGEVESDIASLSTAMVENRSKRAISTVDELDYPEDEIGGPVDEETGHAGVLREALKDTDREVDFKKDSKKDRNCVSVFGVKRITVCCVALVVIVAVVVAVFITTGGSSSDNGPTESEKPPSDANASPSPTPGPTVGGGSPGGIGGTLTKAPTASPAPTGLHPTNFPTSIPVIPTSSSYPTGLTPTGLPTSTAQPTGLIPTVTPETDSPSSAPTFLSWKKIGMSIDGMAAGALAGYSVATSSDGKYVVVGSPSNDQAGSDTGIVRVLFRSSSSSSWFQIGRNLTGVVEGDNAGSGCAISNDGQQVAVFANQLGNDGLGYVKVYRWSPLELSWLQLGNTIRGGSDGDKDTVAMSNDGNTIIIGSLREGLAHIYRYDSSTNTWVRRGLPVFGVAFFGRAVDISGDGSIVFVGAPGVARFFSYDEIESRYLPFGNSLQSDDGLFGSAVAISEDGTTGAVGTPRNPQGGELKVYRRFTDVTTNATEWRQMGQTIRGENTGDLAGVSIALSHDGTTVAVGAHLNDGINGVDAGHVRVFDFNGNAWSQRGMDIDGEAAGDRSGYDIAMSSDGNSLVIGSYSNDNGGTDAGQVRVYEWS